MRSLQQLLLSPSKRQYAGLYTLQIFRKLWLTTRMQTCVLLDWGVAASWLRLSSPVTEQNTEHVSARCGPVLLLQSLRTLT